MGLQRLPWTIMGLGFAAASVGSFVSPSEAACSPAVEVELGVCSFMLWFAAR